MGGCPGVVGSLLKSLKAFPRMFQRYIGLCESKSLGQYLWNPEGESCGGNYIESSYARDFEAGAYLCGQTPLRSAQNNI